MHLSAVKKKKKAACFKHFLLFWISYHLHSRPCLQSFLLAQISLSPELN